MVQRVPAGTLFVGLGPAAGKLQRYAFDEDVAEPFFRFCRSVAAEMRNEDAIEPVVLLSPTGNRDDDPLQRLAVAETLAKWGYNALEPRVPRGVPHGGEWTTVGDESGGDDAPVRLPPGERIDELGDLLEWIANAKREDASAIRADIKRLYYDAGDTVGGNALNRALSNVLSDYPLSRAERRSVLDDFERYTRVDPAEAADLRNALAGAALLAPLLSLPAAGPSLVWKLGPAVRGQRIEEALGANLLRNFPVIDKFADVVATSIKSVDRNAARLSARLNAYVDRVAAFEGREWATQNIESTEITSRVLNVAVPKGSITALQRAAIAAARARAKVLGVDLVITPF